MAGVTDSGWIGKSFQQLLDELAAAAKTEFGEDFPTTPDSVFGQLANIFGASTKDLWDLGQAATDAQNRDAATGVYLDYLANLIGLSRISASGATGNLLFTGEQAAVIPAFFPCADQLNRNVVTQDELVLTRADCYQSTFSVATLANNTPYTVTVEGVDYTYLSDSNATVNEIVNGLYNAIFDPATPQTTFTGEVNGETLVLTWGSQDNLLTTTNTANLSLDSIGSLVSAESSVTGDLSFPENTITKLGSSILTIDSVTNPFDFTTGRYEETDEELRIRMELREQSTGTATKPAIEAALSEVEGVVRVLLIENTSMVEDPITNIPAKSYEVFITGGDAEDIANALWETKPAGIPTHGNITKTIIDGNGDKQAVKFSRPTPLYAWMIVDYSINSEEIFPANGEQLMRDAVVSFGNNLELGEDYEPTKFYAPLYTVEGVYVDQIKIAVTTNQTPPPIGEYQTTRIPISATEVLSFADSQVTIA